MSDELNHQYKDLLAGSYDCVDRIVLNGYFRMGHNPGGFRAWWRALFGSDENLDDTHLMRMAGRFSRRRLRALAKNKGIPIIYCAPAEKKHEIAEEYFSKHPLSKGLFPIYQYSIYQIDYSRNLLFEVRRKMDQVFHALIDGTCAPMDLKRH